jgi:hypothetical protein
VAKLKPWLLLSLSAHEISHSYLFSRQGDVGTEEQADAVTSRWGYAMSRARSVVNAGEWR